MANITRFLNPFLKEKKSPFNASQEVELAKSAMDLDDNEQQDISLFPKKPKLDNTALFLGTALGALSGKNSGIGPLAGAIGGVSDVMSGQEAEYKTEKEDLEKRQKNKIKFDEMAYKKMLANEKALREMEKQSSLEKYRNEMINLQRSRIGKSAGPIINPSDEKAFQSLDDERKTALSKSKSDDLLVVMNDTTDPVGSAAARYVYNKKIKDKRFLNPFDELISD